MATRRYRFKKMSQEDLAILQEQFPKAVETVTTRKLVYTTAAKLMDCDVPMHGVVALKPGEEGEEEASADQPDQLDEEVELKGATKKPMQKSAA